MKRVSACLGVVRLQLTVQIEQSVSPTARISKRVNDAELVVENQQQSVNCPACYRFIWGLLRRARESQSLFAIKVKRFYRVRHDHNLLLGARETTQRAASARRYRGASQRYAMALGRL